MLARLQSGQIAITFSASGPEVRRIEMILNPTDFFPVLLVFYMEIELNDFNGLESFKWKLMIKHHPIKVDYHWKFHLVAGHRMIGKAEITSKFILSGFFDQMLMKDKLAKIGFQLKMWNNVKAPDLGLR